ncbi:MAG: flavin prenyltransferase UbiX [Candidatus Caenarcaniphilales bacterium]|nr:flavin prenyltransferase UbiX [Candidatus Caenarcaniphilales bacterium]
MKPITIAITGASGSIYGFRTLEFLLSQGYTVDLVFSETAIKVVQLELGLNLCVDSPTKNKQEIQTYLQNKNIGFDCKNLNIWSADNLAASVSSGSYQSEGMIIIPCSMGALGRIANGTSEDLVSRCADVCLKERKKLVIVPRETPFSNIHLENMLKLSKAGAILVPAMPAFYHSPQTIDDLVNFVVGKTLDVFGLDNELFKRWMSKEK